MKLITAIIKPAKLDEVREALIDADVTRISVSRISGHGQQQDIEIFRGQEVTPNLIPKVQITIACNEEFVETIVKTIINAAKNSDGKAGDGKIFVTPLEKCYRIRTGEDGKDAI